MKHAGMVHLLMLLLILMLSGCGSGFAARQAGGNSQSQGTPSIPTEFKFKRLVEVTSVTQLKAALSVAEPGDDIVVKPGTYNFEGDVLISRPGSMYDRIRIRSVYAGDSLFTMIPGSSVSQGLVIKSPFVIIENLVLRGDCGITDHTKCETGIHIMGGANHVIVRNSVLSEFNVGIRGSGAGVNGNPFEFPDDVIIEGNKFHNVSARETTGQVAMIEVLGGARWTIRRNFMYDFVKNFGDKLSYGILVGGNSREALIESNLLACSRHIASGQRVGISLGGAGASSAQQCEAMDCTLEHTNGFIRNNLVTECSEDGIRLNKAANTQVVHNTIVGTTGVYVMGPGSTAQIRSNIVSDNISAFDGGSITQKVNNQIIDGQNLFDNYSAGDFHLTTSGQSTIMGAARDGQVTSDYCGQSRSATTEAGAIEYGRSGTNNCLNAIMDRFQAL